MGNVIKLRIMPIYFLCVRHMTDRVLVTWWHFLNLTHHFYL